MAVRRTYYQDPWNSKKVWEVARMVRGWYLRQYIAGQQVNKGVRTTKKFIESLGIMEYRKVQPAWMGG